MKSPFFTLSAGICFDRDLALRPLRLDVLKRAVQSSEHFPSTPCIFHVFGRFTLKADVDPLFDSSVFVTLTTDVTWKSKRSNRSIAKNSEYLLIIEAAIRFLLPIWADSTPRGA